MSNWAQVLSTPLLLARTRGSISDSSRSCLDGGPRSTCNPPSIATRGLSTSTNTPASPKPFPMGTTTPWTTPAPGCLKTSPPKRGPASVCGVAADADTFAQDAVHLLLGPSPRRAFSDHNKADDDDPARAFEASQYQARHATQENLSALMVLDLLQKRTVHFCSRYDTVTGASAPPSRPPILLLHLLR